MSYFTWKRALDLCGATLLLAASSPLWAAIACVLLLVQGRPVLYRQRRMGKGNHPFMLLKFRTMLDGEPPRLPDRPVAKAMRDPRVTPVGQVLRRLALDELPQLLNVFKGEMSLIGPRPLPVDDLAQPGWLAHIDEEEQARRLAWASRRHEVLPGITGLWQVTANNEADFANWIACDLAYVEHCSLLLDLRILLLTPWAILRGRRKDAHAGQRERAPQSPSIEHEG